MTIPPRDLVFATGKGRIAAINPIDGSEVWQANVKMSVWTTSAIMTVCLVDGIVVVSCGPHITGLDGETGDQLWTTKVKHLGSTVLLTNARGETGITPGVRHQIIAQQAAAAAAAASGG